MRDAKNTRRCDYCRDRATGSKILDVSLTSGWLAEVQTGRVDVCPACRPWAERYHGDRAASVTLDNFDR